MFFGENVILQYLEPFGLRLLHKLHFVLNNFTTEHLNRCRPDGAQTAWCFDDVQFMDFCLVSATELHAPGAPRPTQTAARRLLIVPFHNTVLDKARLNAILHSEAVQQCIAPRHKDLVGDCMVAYRYDTPIGRRWHNVKRHALMTSDDLNRLRTEPCGCGAVSGEFKSDALTPGTSHLLTTDPTVLPTPNLWRVCQMGSKYRPSVSSAASHLDSTSREQGLHDVTAPMQRFALGAESRIGIPGSMQHWLTEAMFQTRTALDSIPDGTYIQPPDALPYTHADDVEMKQFLGNFKGRGVVCTSVDKADTTIIFACPKLYVDKLMTDLEEGGTYRPTALTQGALLQSHNSFLQHHGILLSWRGNQCRFTLGASSSIKRVCASFLAPTPAL